MACDFKHLSFLVKKKVCLVCLCVLYLCPNTQSVENTDTTEEAKGTICNVLKCIF